MFGTNGHHIAISSKLLLFAALPLVTVLGGAWPVPSALPPHSWETVGHRVFIHGCKSDGLFNETELALAAKFPVMTVEKGQGESLPGWAEDKIAAIAQQYHTARPDGWTIFYMNAHFNWHMYRMSQTVEMNPSFWIHDVNGKPCRHNGDPEFPQPVDGMLLFNMSDAGMRKLFVDTAVNATKSSGHFNGIFVDSAAEAGRVVGPLGTPKPSNCVLSSEDQEQLDRGMAQLLTELQNGVGSNRLVVAKDNGNYTASRFCNTDMPSDSFCSCYSCDVKAPSSVDGFNKQINAVLAAGKRGQVVMMHGETNSDPSAGTLQEQFLFTLAAYLITTTDSGLFGYSSKWYFNGTQWHDEYDKPLGPPKGPAVLQRNGTTWTRSFEHAEVMLNIADHVSSITWDSS